MVALADRVARRLTDKSTVSRSDPVTLQEFGALLGRNGGGGVTKSGVSVSAERTLAVPGWFSGCRYITESVAFLPVSTFRGDKGSRERRADPLWLQRPDDETPWAALVEHWVISMLHRGNAYAHKVRNAVGQVVGLRAIHPDRVKVGQSRDGRKVFQIDGRTDIGFTSREILHIPGMSYNGIVGLDVISVLAEAIGTVAAAEEFAARSFGSGNHLRAYLSLPQTIDTEQAEKLKAQWQRFHQGMTNAHELGILGDSAQYKVISLDPQQVQLLETRQWGVIEVAQILRIPPHKLYELSRSTNNNIEHQSIESVTDSVRPWVERIETWVNFHKDLTPPKNFIEFQMEGLLRGDAESEAKAMNTAIQGGWMTPQQAAQIKNWPAPDELDYFLRPLNMAVIRPGIGEFTPETEQNQ